MTVRFRLPKTQGMVRRQARSWVVRLRGPRAAQLQDSFRRWYEADPAHAAAFEAVSRNLSKSGVASQSEFGRNRTLRRQTALAVTQPRYALAAAISAIVLIPTGVLLSERGIGPFGTPKVFLLATSLGEIRKVELADGSSVTLDTSSSVRVELKSSSRRAVLNRGRVRFSVAADSRPFVVETDAATFITRDAVMDVERANGQSRIEVLSGTASVNGGTIDQAPNKVALTKGDALSTSGNSTIARYRASAGQPDWTKGMLRFNATPLVEAVARANLYSDRKILLAGDINGLLVTGAYRAGDTGAFAASLAAAFHLTLRRTSAGDFQLASLGTSTVENKKGR